MRPLYLVDSSMYVFRAWFSMPNEFFDTENNPTNAVQGFTRFVCELIEREKPEHIFFAFDESLDTNFRNELYPAYKANRDPAPIELKRQFGYCKQICRALGFGVLANGEYEADDLIGSALMQARASGQHSLILSADKDLSQLLGEHDVHFNIEPADQCLVIQVKRALFVYIIVSFAHLEILATIENRLLLCIYYKRPVFAQEPAIGTLSGRIVINREFQNLDHVL